MTEIFKVSNEEIQRKLEEGLFPPDEVFYLEKGQHYLDFIFSSEEEIEIELCLYSTDKNIKTIEVNDIFIKMRCAGSDGIHYKYFETYTYWSVYSYLFRDGIFIKREKVETPYA